MKTFVTGGAGFIGSHLVDYLIQQHHEVHVIDDLSSGKRSYLHPQATFHHLDIRSDQTGDLIREEKPNILFHLAAQADVTRSIEDPKFDADVNINGTIQLLKACNDAKVQKFIFSSTSAVYGNLQKTFITESDPATPFSYYGISKLSAESYIQLFHQLYQLPFIILRYGNVYGPRQTAKGEGGVIAVFMEKIRNEQPLMIHGDGEQSRDFVYVDDVVQANIAAMTSEQNGMVQISTGKRTSINQLVASLSSLHNKPLDTVHKAGRKGDIKHSCLANQKAYDLLNWKPNTEIAQGIQYTYSYYQPITENTDN
ncbi:NAD-dependent epimerase/dehydratase family protein [Gracilibacillus salinarum]|uniref:NAD-dependent epimerase/dehydratase family protein n=1 Tax=Gracilibacillus salinarum TaxID=2932255 RepID=A0ABY4GL34_9BACI|nr:NAD-dependent epimerase/dehydratase family protein [Gracilibacillus salinarum]UOQ84885.1 NAD-dependent epimerase/dehydratase family protein [Gracilibacillus salinarum]